METTIRQFCMACEDEELLACFAQHPAVSKLLDGPYREFIVDWFCADQVTPSTQVSKIPGVVLLDCEEEVYILVDGAPVAHFEAGRARPWMSFPFTGFVAEETFGLERR